MHIEVDQRSAVPPYEQIRVRITELVAIGALEPSSRLPTVRQLAADLGVAPGTVARAYRELELDGMVVSRGRHGTVVTGHGTTLPADKREALTRAAVQFFDFATSIGARPPEIDEALETARP